MVIYLNFIQELFFFFRCSLSDFHITFGNVKNMSSRSGQVLLLETILEEASKKSHERMMAQVQQQKSAGT